MVKRKTGELSSTSNESFFWFALIFDAPYRSPVSDGKTLSEKSAEQASLVWGFLFLFPL